jgi:hypothetical protein
MTLLGHSVTGEVRAFSVNDVCVEENFYRVLGPNGEAHNRVEAMFGVVDAELGRIQSLFERLEDPEDLQLDDLIGLGVGFRRRFVRCRCGAVGRRRAG